MVLSTAGNTKFRARMHGLRDTMPVGTSNTATIDSTATEPTGGRPTQAGGCTVRSLDYRDGRGYDSDR